MQRLTPTVGQPSQDQQKQAIVIVKLRSADAAPQNDNLLTEHSVLDEELRPRASEIPGRTDDQVGHGAGRAQQALECAYKRDEQTND